MAERENVPDDFPPAQFTLFAFCEACRHHAPIERARIPVGVSVGGLKREVPLLPDLIRERVLAASATP
jgi:hypothetical protein